MRELAPFAAGFFLLSFIAAIVLAALSLVQSSPL
jgi:hypothetical protein